MNLLDVLLPATCLSCGRDLIRPGALPVPLCASCHSKIRWLTHGEFMPESSVSFLYASADFEGPVRDLIHSFKYNGKEHLGGYFGGQWAASAPLEHGDIDAIIPVPMSPWKEFKRGYNPARVFGKSISNKWGVPLVTGELSRRWISRSQTGLKRGARAVNARCSFKLKSQGVIFRGRSCLLVDDVCTTGATLEACARLLMRAGARRVFAGVAARERLGGRS